MIFNRDAIAAIRAEAAQRLGPEALARGNRRPDLSVSRATQGPLSFPQSRFWAMERTGLGGPHLHIPVTRLFECPVDAVRMHHAFRGALMAHPVLRTRFLTGAGGIPYQEIDAEPAAELVIQNVEAGGGRPEGILRAFFNQRFDLAREHPIRALFLAENESRSWLAFSFHHIAFDGFHSLANFLSSLSEGYIGNLIPAQAGNSPGFLDFCRWQGEMATRGFFKEGLEFWSDQLRGIPAEPVFAQQPSSQAGNPFFADRIIVKPSRETCRRLKDQWSRLEPRPSPHAFHLGICALAVLAVSGRRDIAIGSTVSGRAFADLNGLVGLFINTLPIRAGIGGRSSLAEFFGAISERYRSCLEHQDVPMDLILKNAEIPRVKGATPVFQILFDYKIFKEGGEIGGLPCRIIEANDPYSVYGLSFWAIDREGELHYALDFRRSAFDASRRVRLQRVLEETIGSLDMNSTASEFLEKTSSKCGPD